MKIKIIVWIVALLGSTTISFAQQNMFVLKGKINGQQAGYVKLNYAGANGSFVADSVAIQNGSFEFKGNVDGPVMAYLTSNAVKSRAMDDPNMGTFFIEPANLVLELTAGDFKNLKLTGSKTQDEMMALNLSKKGIMDKLAVINAEYNAANMAYGAAKKAGKPEAELEVLKEAATAVKDKGDPLRAESNKIDMAFVKSNPDSYYTAYILRYRVSSLPLAESKAIYAKLSDRIKQSAYGKEINKEIKSLQGGSPGSVASMFSSTDINGQPLSLADFKGKKYVLLDFWASWCVPCRKGNPHLLSLYSKYKDKGLEIVGVSDDDGNHEAWKKAVAQDQIGVWKHVLRGLKWKGQQPDKSSDITEPYAIHSLPTKILIDKNGIIIGRYGGGGEDDAAMDKKLEELFK